MMPQQTRSWWVCMKCGRRIEASEGRHFCKSMKKEREMSRLICVNDKIVVELTEKERESQIYIPEPAIKGVVTGKVLSVGPLVGDISKGDSIMFRYTSAVEIKHLEQNFYILGVKDVLCVILE